MNQEMATRMQEEVLATIKKCQEQLNALDEWRRKQGEEAVATALPLTPEKEDEPEEWVKAKEEVE